MRFRLWHKLVITIVSITSIVLLIAIMLSNHTVKSGFLAYLNAIEESRLDNLADILLNDYETHKNWDFIKNNRALWNRYFTQSKPSNRKNGDNTRPRQLRQLGSRPGEERRRKTPLRENRFPPPPKEMALLDVNKTHIVGGKKPSAQAELKSIRLNDEVVGYLRFEPFTKITEGLDQQFLSHQTNAFIKIAILSLGIVLIGAWLFANYLRKRINTIGRHAGRLTSGNFAVYPSDASADELGQLSRKLKFLGETLERNRLSREQWMSDISHELRTPVAVLQGEIEAIQDGVRKLTSESIDSLHQEVVRLGRLVNDLHELSMSDLGALSYDKESINIVELIDDVLTSHQIQFDEKCISTNINAVDSSIMINGDGQRLEQLFSNLANNSRLYTSESGAVIINIKQKKSKVIIRWEDSIPGVAGVDLVKLFDRLYRVNTSRNRNTGGSGLGLAICKNIVKAHDGSIDVDHSDLGGVKFTITFPLLIS